MEIIGRSRSMNFLKGPSKGIWGSPQRGPRAKPWWGFVHTQLEKIWSCNGEEVG